MPVIGLRTGCSVSLLIALLLGMPTQARDLPVALDVKPVLCITDRRNPSCEMSLLIAWRSATEGSFCLYSDFASVTPISCWAAQSSGQFMEQRTVALSFSYWLTTSESQLRVAEASVDVVSTDVEDRRRNRRKRFAWSVL